MKRNLWLLPVFVVYFAIYLSGIISGHFWLVGLAMLIILIGSLLVTIHAHRFVLALDGQKKLATDEKSVSALFLPVLAICLMAAFATLGASVLFILPGIWFGIASCFCLSSYLEDGTTGVGALSASMSLVKGRWWSTLWSLSASFH